MNNGRSDGQGDVDTVAALEDVVGKAPPMIQLKVIDHLDELALRWIAASPLAFVTFAQGQDVTVTLAGGASGFASGEAAILRLPLDMVDDPAMARPGTAFGSLFLAPGIGETLRVNGTVSEVHEREALIRVQECYVHCAKALIRSEFWSAEPIEAPPGDARAFTDACRFMALATIDDAGHADLSPKGDPAGLMVRLDGDSLWFADRPGNRRVDSFRNIIEQPRIAATLLIPGSHSIVLVNGTAALSTDAAQCERFTVRGKVPHLTIRIDDLKLDLQPSPALARAALWPAVKAEGLNPAKMFAAHVKLNKEKSLAARIGGVVLSIPGLMQKGLDKDYKDNLY